MNIDAGIYKFTNKITGKVYIGQTKYLNTRYREHKSELINRKHHNPYFQNAVNKYDFDAFDYEILTRCEVHELNELEVYYINLYDSTNRDKGYNLGAGGDSGSLSPETIEKIRISHYGTNNKLTEKEVSKIKHDLLSGKSCAELATIYNVKISTISKIARGKNWKQVDSHLNHALYHRNDK